MSMQFSHQSEASDRNLLLNLSAAIEFMVNEACSGVLCNAIHMMSVPVSPTSHVL